MEGASHHDKIINWGRLAYQHPPKVSSSPCWMSRTSSPPSSWWTWSPWGWSGRSSWPGPCPPRQWEPLGENNIIIHYKWETVRIWILPLFIWDHSFTFNVILRKFSMEMFLISIFCFSRFSLRYPQYYLQFEVSYSSNTYKSHFLWNKIQLSIPPRSLSLLTKPRGLMSNNTLFECVVLTDVEILFLIALRPRNFSYILQIIFPMQTKGIQTIPNCNKLIMIHFWIDLRSSLNQTLFF